MTTDLKLFIVDDTDVAKPYGKRFESLGRVKDGSAIRITYEKGYRVTSIVWLSTNVNHPLPFYDVFHSEIQVNFNSINKYTSKGLSSIIFHLKDYESCFVFDRGYDDNKLFNYFLENKQYFIVRL